MTLSQLGRSAEKEQERQINLTRSRFRTLGVLGESANFVDAGMDVP